MEDEFVISSGEYLGRVMADEFVIMEVLLLAFSLESFWASNLKEHRSSWWADFHRNAAAARARRGSRQPPIDEAFGGLLQDQQPIYTFTPQRLAPLVTVTQNDGTRVTTASGPVLRQPLQAPAIKRPFKGSRAMQRAQALLDSRPSADEVLLAQLAAGPNRRKRKLEQPVCSGSKRAKTDAGNRVQKHGGFSLLNNGISMGGGHAITDSHVEDDVQIAPVADPQWGERYVRMDYDFFDALRTQQRAHVRAELADLRHYAAYFRWERPTSEGEWWEMLACYQRSQVTRTLFLDHTIMSRPSHCAVPIHLDPGASGANIQKYYLVTGVKPEVAGAYGSWPSADAQYKKVPSATLKGYTAAEWPALESAWRAACERGEHGALHSPLEPKPSTPQTARHGPVKTQPQTQPLLFSPSRASSSRASPAVPRRVPAGLTDSRSVSPVRTVVIESRSPSPAESRSPSPAGTTYAVRVGSGGVGQVFEEYRPARAYFHRLQRDGARPVLSVCQGLTAAVAFIEEMPDKDREASTESEVSASD
ncbi:hypothetical protein B0H11DRAFT_1910325 [Mycena galericulata]|nr:hypothetical protein B0H11DRAFT_1910325 [Mycena galericulata]